MTSSGNRKGPDFLSRDRTVTRLEGLRRSLQLTDKVLYGRDVQLNFPYYGAGTHPATSTKTNIDINMSLIGNPFSGEGLATILGLNYHEVAHMLYSVGSITELRDAYWNRYNEDPHAIFQQAYVTLEEHRIESIYIARYPRMKYWFTFPVIQFLVRDQNQWDTAFLLTHGRKYLPQHTRDMFRQKFEKRIGHSADGYASLIDQYRVMSLGRKAGREAGADIINRFAELLERDGLKNFMSPAHGGVAQTGGGASAADQESAAKEANNQQKADNKKEREDKKRDAKAGSNSQPVPADDPPNGEREENRPDTQDGSGGGQDRQERTGGEDDPGGSGTQSGDGDHEESQSSADSQQSSGQGGGDEGHQDHVGGGAGQGNVSDRSSAPAQALPDYAVKDSLREVLREALSDQQVQEELGTLYNAMDSASALGSTLERRAAHTMAPVTPGMLAKADAVADVLRGLWALMEPGWVYGTPEGTRIDMNRAASARSAEDYETIYDDFEPGQQDSAGLEVVILADESSSTRGNGCSPIMSRNLWELRYALQEIDAKVTVLSFQDYCSTMASREDTVTTREYALLAPSGGTVPAQALEEARRILSGSEMPNRLLIVLTDGEWFYGYRDEATRKYSETLEYIGDIAVRLVVLIKMKSFQLEDSFDIVETTYGDILDPMARAVRVIMERTMR